MLAEIPRKFGSIPPLVPNDYSHPFDVVAFPKKDSTFHSPFLIIALLSRSSHVFAPLMGRYDSIEKKSMAKGAICFKLD